MSSSPSPCLKEDLRAQILNTGAVRVGFARADKTPEDLMQTFRQWIASGKHGEMRYLERYDDVRADVSRLLPDVRTIISVAYAYRPPSGFHHPFIADYALGDDYHYVLKRRLEPIVRLLHTCGAAPECRIAVDTLPLFERYWAVQAGLGFIGRNHQLIIPNIGSDVFLAEILTTLAFEPDQPCNLACGDCDKCIKACPGNALAGDFDARKCLSYLTIEYRGEFDGSTDLHGKIYGCDVCRRVCPYNRGGDISTIEEFAPHEQILALDKAKITSMTRSEFAHLSRNSPISRISLKMLKRNARF